MVYKLKIESYSGDMPNIYSLSPRDIKSLDEEIQNSLGNNNLKSVKFQINTIDVTSEGNLSWVFKSIHVDESINK